MTEQETRICFLTQHGLWDFNGRRVTPHGAISWSAARMAKWRGPVGTTGLCTLPHSPARSPPCSSPSQEDVIIHAHFGFPAPAHICVPARRSPSPWRMPLSDVHCDFVKSQRQQQCWCKLALAFPAETLRGRQSSVAEKVFTWMGKDNACPQVKCLAHIMALSLPA